MRSLPLVALAIVVLMGATSVTCQSRTVAPGFYKAPTFTLDLDKAPENRWDGAVKLITDLHGFENSFGPIFTMYEPRFNFIPDAVRDLLVDIVKTRFPEHYGELQGITKQLLAAGQAAGYNTSVFSIEKMVPWIYFYEFGDLSMTGTRRRGAVSSQLDRSCTGILSLPVDKSQPIIHGRNMDESPIDGRNCTLDITVVKGGSTQFHIFDWTWMTTGFYTGSRLGAVTLEENWRTHSDLNFLQIMGRILDNATVPTIFMFRNILSSGMDFDQAVNYLNSTQFAAPFYAIMSGTNRRGAVVTTFFNKTDNVIEFLNDNSTTSYMVQTNYDRWLPDPQWDPRRTVAENHLAMVGRERSGTDLGVWMAASVYPVHNRHTMYTALLSAEKRPEGYVRIPMYPDY